MYAPLAFTQLYSFDLLLKETRRKKKGVKERSEKEMLSAI